ncbi:hypothetical protein [Geobacter sulfurreducens]|uniref:hypothetical protein n=1 Tax=Geobacter sulfurreducens TaxID=35554 RepID=UPI0020B757CC|nr:hypothetical protein [Geobacter sulfurreducens]UTG91746.1 hypothetical protein J8622_11990 [Geobacter sulfurreducens]
MKRTITLILFCILAQNVTMNYCFADVLSEAYTYFKNKNYDNALPLLENLVTEGNLDAYNLLGTITAVP